LRDTLKLPAAFRCIVITSSWFDPFVSPVLGDMEKPQGGEARP